MTDPHHAHVVAAEAPAPTPRAAAMSGSYVKLVGMVVVSTVLMYCLSYANTYVIDHVFWSQTRAFMALLMGSVMTVVMLAFMRGMYRNRRANLAIVASAATVFVASLVLVRSQATVDDRAYMKSMIPHHSVAILTSTRARIEDPRVRKLADGIIATQRREIDEMKRLLDDLDRD